LDVLVKGLKQNCSLVYLDIGSNDISYEGAEKLFQGLERHKTISHLTLANHDRLHRNRIGPKACESLLNLLNKNKILSMLNISDNAIQNEGLKCISPALNKDSNLTYLNLGNNELNGI